jgi:hypothetical protein
MSPQWFAVCALACFGLVATPCSAERTQDSTALRRSAPRRFADIDPENDRVVAPPDPIANCEARLRASGIEYRVAQIPLKQKRGGTYTCGASQAVVYLRGPEGIRYNAAPLVSCGLALALAEFEHVLEEEALRVFGKRVLRIEQGGTYNCRRMTRFRDLVSEHSYGNAIDVRALVLADGRRISILRDFGALAEPPNSDKARLLRGLARRLYDQGVFSVVLTPYWDALHRDHFHLDLARYRVDGTR